MGNTISENKATALAVGTAAVTALGGYLFYKQYKSEQPDEQEEVKALQAVPKKNTIDVRSQITYFKSQIDANNPTLQDIKQLFRILSTHVKAKTFEVSEKFRTDRRKRFPKDRRFNDVVEYFRYSIEGIMALQKKVMELQGEQTQLLGLAGISQAKFAQYAAQLGPFMQELIFSSDVSLEDLKRSLEIKTEYLQAHGQRIFQILIELSATLTLQQKQHIPIFLNIVMSDEAFQNDPALDKQQFDMAYEKYKKQLGEEMTKFEQVLMPLMQKLQTALIGDEMGGMGGYGGYPGQGFGDYDQMGGMGMNEQMMMQQIQQLRIADPQAYEQMQQIQQLRIADPQAYEQFIMMMQAQASMGR